MYTVHLKRVLPITRRPYSKQLPLYFLQDNVISGVFRCGGKSAKSACHLLHVCLSVCSHGTTRLPRDGFS